MGIPVLILGESGSGKSASMRNFKENEIGIFNVAGKPLPFKSKIKPYNVSLEAKKNNKTRYQMIGAALGKSKTIKSYVIDDSQYLLSFDSFDKANETGYTKFTTMAVSFKNLIDYVVNDLPDDIIVYFLHHTETNENGKIKAKTIGKMLDSQITLEGLFSIVLLCQTDGTKHTFITQSDGFTTAKSPMDMFELEIDNDLKFVDKTIREYYGI